MATQITVLKPEAIDQISADLQASVQVQVDQVSGDAEQTALDRLAAAESADAAELASIKNITTSNPTTQSQLTNVKLVPFRLYSETVINRLSIDVIVADTAAKLAEVGIYNSARELLVRSGPRELTPAGEMIVAVPETNLPAGKYYVGVPTDSTIGRVGVNEYGGGEVATAAFPLPNPPASPTLSAAAPSVTIRQKYLPPLQGLFEIETGRTVRVYGQDASNRQPWGLNTSTFNMAMSIDSGHTFIDKMTVPPGALTTGAGIADVIVEGGKLYVLCNNLDLHESSDLSATATWTDISCPVSAGLRSGNATARPYGLGVVGGHIFIGEYTSGAEVRTTGMSPGPDPVRGPRIFRFDLTARTWALSAEFLSARHIHSFHNQGSVALFASLGDAGWGDQIGLQRLTPSGIGAGPGGTDSWLQWTTPVAPRTNHYPVDFLLVPAAEFNGESQNDAKFILTSDRPEYHLLEAARNNTVAGSVNMGVQTYQPPGRPATETVRSLVMDTDTGNLFYWTAETTEPALFMSPPPYTQTVKLYDFAPGEANVLLRSVYVNGYVMMFNSRFRVEKFVGQ